MSFPQVVTEAGSNSTIAATSHVVTLPSGVTAGDLVVVLFGCAPARAISWPVGWNEDLDLTVSGGAEAAGNIGARIADGTEGATVTVTTGNTAMFAARAVRIGRHYPTAPIEYSTGATGASTAPDSPSLNPSWAGQTLWLAMCVYDQGQRTITAYPTNYTNGTNDRANDPNGVGLGMASRPTTNTPEDPAAFTISASDEWLAITAAIRSTPTRELGTLGIG